MNPEEKAAFAKANETIHTVESQWHYPIMTKYNWVPLTKSAVGFVRSYKYQHPKNPKETIEVSTGVNADYWYAGDTFGYWADLEPYLKSL